MGNKDSDESFKISKHNTTKVHRSKNDIKNLERLKFIKEKSLKTEIIPEKLRKLRKLLNLSQEQLSSKLDVSVQKLRNIESNLQPEMSINKIEELAELLNVPIAEIAPKYFARSYTYGRIDSYSSLIKLFKFNEADEKIIPIRLGEMETPKEKTTQDLIIRLFSCIDSTKKLFNISQSNDLNKIKAQFEFDNIITDLNKLDKYLYCTFAFEVDYSLPTENGEDMTRSSKNEAWSISPFLIIHFIIKDADVDKIIEDYNYNLTNYAIEKDEELKNIIEKFEQSIPLNIISKISKKRSPKILDELIDKIEETKSEGG